MSDNRWLQPGSNNDGSPRGEFSNREDSGKPRFAVIRHAERADSWGGDGQWVNSADFQRFPMDPPLTREGIAVAGEVGQQVARDLTDVHGENGPVTLVSSPFFRCVQTAVELCRATEPGSKILIDHELGEVYGREIFGECEPQDVLRSMDESIAYCHNHGVEVEPVRVGRLSRWPEKVQEARFRLLCRFLHYLKQGFHLKKNFALITHSDGVIAALSAMPSMRTVSVAKVGNCGYFLGIQRSIPDGQLHLSQSGSWLPPQSESDSESVDWPELQCRHASFDWACPARGPAPQRWRASEQAFTQGWVVEQFGIEVELTGSEPLTSRIRRWSRNSEFSEKNIRGLLKCGSWETSAGEGSWWSAETSSCLPAGSTSMSESTDPIGLSNSKCCAGDFGSQPTCLALLEESQEGPEEMHSALSSKVPELMVGSPAGRSEDLSWLQTVKASSLMVRRNARRTVAL
mmetsp:Transcript_45094/g.97972  ORF Transcript_45094/g.97972 Transcript_45094/m.97972 type:complete len:459 (+) Transcript_45094:46-1422(+)